MEFVCLKWKYLSSKMIQSLIDGYDNNFSMYLFVFLKHTTI